MLALDGNLKGKSHREIAVDLFGTDGIEGLWHDGLPERGVVRRRLTAAKQLMEGGYRDLVTGRGRPLRALGRSRSISRPDARWRAGSSLPAGGSGWLNARRTRAGRAAMIAVQPRYMDTSQAGSYLGLSPSTLARMRVTGGGPRYSKAGRRVIYDVDDLDSWVEERKRRFTGESEDD